MEYNGVWVFNSPSARVSGGVFEDIGVAEEWIMQNKLTGILTKYPLNIGTLEWAIDNGLVNMKPQKLNKRRSDPDFIGGFTSASMEHNHYENGQKQQNNFAKPYLYISRVIFLPSEQYFSKQALPSEQEYQINLPAVVKP